MDGARTFTLTSPLGSHVFTHELVLEGGMVFLTGRGMRKTKGSDSCLPDDCANYMLCESAADRFSTHHVEVNAYGKLSIASTVHEYDGYRVRVNWKENGDA
jgi:hypothetical protein